MTNRKYRSFGSHLLALLFILASVSLVGDVALARTASVRRPMGRARTVSNISDAASPAARYLLLAERPRRVLEAEPAQNLHLSWTSDVLYRSMPKSLADGRLAGEVKGTLRVPFEPAVPLDTWPGLNFRNAPDARVSVISLTRAPAGEPEPYLIRMSDLIDPTKVTDTSGSPAGTPGQKGSGTVSTAPMTAGEKFTYFLRKSFLSPASYGLSIFGGMISEALDSHEHHNDAGGFIADGMTHAARSFAFRSTANFFEKFAYATMFKQDPRYHRSNNSGVGAKIGYAISRVFITQGDRGGRQFNAAFIVGGLSAAGMSNLWERDEHVNIGDTFVRWGEHVGFTALYNVLREFIGGQ